MSKGFRFRVKVMAWDAVGVHRRSGFLRHRRSARFAVAQCGRSSSHTPLLPSMSFGADDALPREKAGELLRSSGPRRKWPHAHATEHGATHRHFFLLRQLTATVYVEHWQRILRSAPLVEA